MTPSTMTRRLMALGAAATLVLSAGACSAGSDKKAATESGSATTVAAASKTGSGSTDGGSGSDGGSATTTTAPSSSDDDAVVGSSTGQLRADPNDPTLVPLRLDVRSVERLDGDTIEVRFAITNTGEDGDATFEAWTELGDDTITASGTYDVGGAALLDRPNDKKYLTLFDSKDVCLCTGGGAQLAIAPGTSAELYADITAPPESVKTVDLSLPGFKPVNGLEIS
ncbi:hypothetical protein KSP35_21385 [Aquihabitans sp. G128]|uniref:hypothetical protein n=1 Tax=Aquihabitans sp. G128 TaxID=2849779 RepID=UPI001C215D13|nr:hypothetical protein [Aquihabitans sp. G128]QXC60843.1 hypothetical protein KSP35_21385 [Aquihabitans sp. G128]